MYIYFRGAYSTVHRVIEKSSGKNWAARFCRYAPVDKESIKHELGLMSELHHPKLLQLHHVFDSKSEFVIVTEL